jgi:hypothetical protein
VQEPVVTNYINIFFLSCLGLNYGLLLEKYVLFFGLGMKCYFLPHPIIEYLSGCSLYLVEVNQADIGFGLDIILCNERVVTNKDI